LLAADGMLLPHRQFLRSLDIGQSSVVSRIVAGQSWMSVVAAGFLSSCASTANVPLSYAKLDTGYLNSGIYDLGALFVWDRIQQTLSPLPPLSVPKSMRNMGSTIEQQQNTLSSDTEIDFSGDVAKVATASLKAQIAHSTTAELTNVASETARTTRIRVTA
jgi:hypothetical protein